MRGLIIATIALSIAGCDTLPKPPGDLGSGGAIEGPIQFYALCQTPRTPYNQKTLDAMKCPKPKS